MKKMYIFLSILIFSLLIALLLVSCGDSEVVSLDDGDFNNGTKNTSSATSALTESSRNTSTYTESSKITDFDSTLPESIFTESNTVESTSKDSIKESAESENDTTNKDMGPFLTDGDAFINDNEATYNDAWN